MITGDKARQSAMLLIETLFSMHFFLYYVDKSSGAMSEENFEKLAGHYAGHAIRLGLTPQEVEGIIEAAFQKMLQSIGQEDTVN